MWAFRIMMWECPGKLVVIVILVGLKRLCEAGIILICTLISKQLTTFALTPKTQVNNVHNEFKCFVSLQFK